METSTIQVDSLQLQERDLAFLRGLFECRVMNASHAATIFFDKKRAYATKRIRQIKAAGLVSERKRRMNEPSVLFLTRKGFTLLKNHGKISEFPQLGANSFEARASVSELTLRHELEIMDVKAAFHGSLAKDEKHTLLEFSTWPILHQFEVSRNGYGSDVLVKPDGFISIHEKEEGTKGYAHDCFLEVDRSSETLETLVNRSVCYLEYYRSGGFAARIGAARDKFRDYPFRVLIVLKSAERRNNLAERLAQNNPPILSQVWLSTFAEVKSDPLGQIWIKPGEYRAATKDTQFYREVPKQAFAFRRQPEREAFVEKHVPKHRILTEE